MRTLAFLLKTFLENLRDWKVLILALVFAPFFVYLMYGYFEAGVPSYRILVLDHGADTELAEAWTAATHPDGSAMFTLTAATDLDAALAKLRGREADLLVEIPADFSERLAAFQADPTAEPPRIVNHGDPANMRSTMAVALSDYTVFTWVATITRAPMPLQLEFQSTGGDRSLSEFDLYVPSLLVLAIIMVLFTAAATLVKEVDRGTIQRLMLSRLTTLEFVTAVSLNQVLIGMVALGLAFAAAFSVGYRTEGSWLAILVVGAISTLSVVAIAVLVSAFLRSIFELLTVGTFPFFILMFFSDCFFPLPRIPLFNILGHTLHANDILPTAITVKAFDRILNSGAGLGDVRFEIGLILLLTLVYFTAGTACFRWRHQRV